jgi:hypothetical protein
MSGHLGLHAFPHRGIAGISATVPAIALWQPRNFIAASDLGLLPGHLFGVGQSAKHHGRNAECNNGGGKPNHLDLLLPLDARKS